MLEKLTFFLKKYIWPIEREELKLFLPLAVLMFCILFNFSALRSIKDSLVVSDVGAEAISFLKLWLVLPLAIIFTISYVKLSNILKIDHMFYVVISFFVSFFLLFAFVFYPHQEFFHPGQDTVNYLITQFPYLKWFIKLFGKWTFALMYAFGELWSAVVINLMFWQFANHIINTECAKRFYPMLGMVGNIGLIAAGSIIVSCSNISALPEEYMAGLASYYSTEEEFSLKVLILAITISSMVAMYLFGYISRLFETQIVHPDHHSIDESKTRLSVRESIKLIMHSKYVAHIAFIVLSYGLAINVLEGPWKAKIHELYPTTHGYLSYMGKFNIWMGISSVLFTIIAGNLIRHFSWLFAALMTPIVILVTGTLFFCFVIFGDLFTEILGTYAFNPIAAAVFIGALQNILSKSTKYSLFDSTKEMAYIPLSVELRTKGKATVEVIAAKLGKSTGAFVQSAFFTIVPTATFASIGSTLMTVFIVIMVLWVINVYKLNREYNAKLALVEKRM